ncbi:gastrula zinc finger protein XlCGF48.2-like [Macrobrachium nipponense]|uniref:gastrula zinc finger protein XlCGF48.2-like n=1 Tax=Macrobrachium nipponense TaxID=159736 RepID=UPI0030C7E319
MEVKDPSTFHLIGQDNKNIEDNPRAISSDTEDNSIYLAPTVEVKVKEELDHPESTEEEDPLSFSPNNHDYKNFESSSALITDSGDDDDDTLYQGPSVKVEVKADPEVFEFGEMTDSEKDSLNYDDNCRKNVIGEENLLNQRKHIKGRKDEKKFTCAECGRSFSQSHKLKVHMRTHTGERPYSCTECQSSFAVPHSLRVHMRSHTGEKPFSCSECGSKFVLSGHLRKHMRIHTGEKALFLL